MSNMEELARRAVACDGWRWMRGMLCLTDEDGYAARILHVGLTARQSETADSYDGGGIITRGCIREGSLPDLTDPATIGCLLALVREAWNEAEATPLKVYRKGRWVWVMVHHDEDDMGPPGNTETGALVAALEAAGASND